MTSSTACASVASLSLVDTALSRFSVNSEDRCIAQLMNDHRETQANLQEPPSQGSTARRVVLRSRPCSFPSRAHIGRLGLVLQGKGSSRPDVRAKERPSVGQDKELWFS
jgi:hypothetical protein